MLSIVISDKMYTNQVKQSIKSHIAAHYEFSKIFDRKSDCSSKLIIFIIYFWIKNGDKKYRDKKCKKSL